MKKFGHKNSGAKESNDKRKVPSKNSSTEVMDITVQSNSFDKKTQDRNLDYSSSWRKNNEKLSESVISFQRVVSVNGHVNHMFCNDEADCPVDKLSIQLKFLRHLDRNSEIAPKQFQDATDLHVIGKSRDLIVTDLINGKLQKLTDNCQQILDVNESVKEPWACVVTRDNLIAVTSRCTSRVVLLASDGRVVGSFGENVFSCPSGIAVTSEGLFVVTDCAKSSVHVFHPDGTHAAELLIDVYSTKSFQQPRYVVVTPQENIIVSDSGNHRLVIFDRNFKFVHTIGSFGKSDGQFKFPHATCVDKCGRIFVCDRYNNRVSLFSQDGQFAGHVLTSKSVLSPQALALTSNGHLLVSHGRLKARRLTMFKVVVRPSLAKENGTIYYC